MTPRRSWRIRPAAPGDREFILGLTDRLADGFTLPAWRTVEEVARAEDAHLDQALGRPGEDTALLVAEDDRGDRGGFVYLQTLEDWFRRRPHAHVAVLAVTRAAEGTGAGRALLQAADAWARDRGLEMITLNVFEPNTRARAVYDRLGYRPETLRYVKLL